MFIIDYHCPYHSMYFEVIQEMSNFHQKKKIINNLYPNKNLTIKYLTKVNLKILKTVYKNSSVKN